MINEKQIRKYCCGDISKIDNYECAIKDKIQVWDCHHKKEIENGLVVSVEELVRNGLYYSRPPDELMFLTKSQHSKLHNKGKCPWDYRDVRKHADEEKMKISRSRANVVYSKETCKKISDAKKGKKLSEEHKKKLSECSARFWLGKHLSEETKDKLRKKRLGTHLSYEARKKMSMSRTGMWWYNNGEVEIKARECPEGYVRGRLKRAKK